jgi:membrane protease subunit HflK
MPWSNQNGGGGGGGGPWGQRPSGGSGGPPDLEDLFKRGQDRLKQAMPGGGMTGILIAGVVMIGLALVAYSSFLVEIKQYQKGVVLRFGKWNRTLEPGLKVRWPYPIEQVFPVDMKNKQIDIGTKGNTTYVSGGTLTDSQMLTGDENIIDVRFYVKWQVKDPRAFKFNIENPETTVKEVADSAMRELAGKKSFEAVRTYERAVVQVEVHKLMQRILDSYGAGILITEVQMSAPNPPAPVLDAFRDVQAAKVEQQRNLNEAEKYRTSKVRDAEGEAKRILLTAQGYKSQTVSEATGQAARFNKVYTQYTKAPDLTRKRLFLETMEKVLSGTNKIILDKKGSGVIPYLPLGGLNQNKGGRQ